MTETHYSQLPFTDVDELRKPDVYGRFHLKGKITSVQSLGSAIGLCLEGRFIAISVPKRMAGGSERQSSPVYDDQLVSLMTAASEAARTGEEVEVGVLRTGPITQINMPASQWDLRYFKSKLYQMATSEELR